MAIIQAVEQAGILGWYDMRDALQARHTQRLEVAQRASRAQQEEELGWDDAEADDQPHPQQSPTPTSSLDNPKHTSQAESAPPASSSTQGAAVGAGGDGAEGRDREVGAGAPGMQGVRQEGGETEVSLSEHRQEATDTAKGTHSKEDHKTAVTAGDEDAADTVTSSESGSGNEHWTVVKSPSKQSSGEDPNALTGTKPSTNSPGAVAAVASTTDQSKPVMSPPTVASSQAAVSQEDDSEIDELDDVSNDGDPDGTPGSGPEEDWGAWE